MSFVLDNVAPAVTAAQLETTLERTAAPSPVVIYAPATPSSVPVLLAAQQMENAEVTIFTDHAQAHTLFLRQRVEEVALQRGEIVGGTLVAGIVNLLNVTGRADINPRLFIVLPLANLCAGLAFLAVPAVLYGLLPGGDK